MEEITFYKPSIDEHEIEAIKEALRDSGVSIVKKLEDKIKNYFNIKHAIATNNSAAAHHLALCSIDLKRGDKVICSVNSIPSVAQAVRHFDAEPIFVDINEDDFNINPNSLREVLKVHNHKKLKGIFVNHVAGQASDMDEIYKIAEEYDVKVFDDVGKGAGLKYNDQKIGSIEKSTISCFCVYSRLSNPIGTAGFLLTNDDDIASRARLLRNHAIVNGIDKDGNLGYIYDVVDIGVKYDLTGLCAAYSMAQLEKNDKFIKRRQEIAAIYDKELADCPHIKTPIKKRDHVYVQYIIKVDKNRDSFAKEMLENGIHTALHYVPIHLLSYYKNKYGLKVNAYPNALKSYQQILSLPIYNALKDEEVYRVCETIREIAKHRV
ncbi:DegT/DnrJ/EryC1/StrS family aminotransferase [Campylobacter sp. RM16192]|uniref:DegT/DnrJ/EryC1/StrS family aminotransferase n=1 Tax=Campylobacter sp. RM16192 TaxID=1660080 RepID=UPI001451A6E0|nr:DegT/DnrJ/EryC1/StrS aminotransferase family protein [Campylobacter sp. RM16192]QCD52857.1 aminotransferase, DegT/DnrJ/EryC1/StrS family [Campylobacter sp. RM16192]